MRRLVYLDPATRDLKSLQKYISRSSGHRAAGLKFVRATDAQCERLAALPGTLGRPRPELGRDFRSFPFNNYIIFFRYRDDVFKVINVVSAYRDLGTVFPGEEP